MTVESRVIVQDYVNVYDLFDIARQAAGVAYLGYTTWLDGVIRTLQTPAGHQTLQISQQYDAAGRPYPAGDGDQPTGWAIVTATTRRHRRRRWCARPARPVHRRTRPLAHRPGTVLVLAAQRR